MAVPPNPRMYYQDQAMLNTLFGVYNLSFENPELIARQLLRMVGNYRNIRDEDELRYYLSTSNGLRLYNLLHNIQDLPLHRHRIDANNILTQFRIRIGGLPGQTILIPTPVEPDYDGPDRLDPAEVAVLDQQIAQLQDLIQRSAEHVLWEPGTDFPLPILQPPFEPHEFIRNVPQSNSDALELIVRDNASNQAVRDAVFNILSADPPPNVIFPPFLIDNPSETCLQMPEDCRFLNDPTPILPNMDEILELDMNDIVIWDFRTGDKNVTGPLGTEHYIYHLISLVREIIRQPDIARAYAIIFRAYPLRYAVGSDDEIADEEPPLPGESR